jgi:hypothetical protein
LALTPSDVREAEEMATYAAGFKPFLYRADEVSKVVLVDNATDKYRTFDSDDAFETVDVKTSLQGQIAEVDPKSALSTYKTVDRAVGSFIPNKTLQQSGSYDPKYQAIRRCRRAIDLDREIDVWTLLSTTTNWNANVRTALAGTYNWDGGANSNPIKDVEDAIVKSWQPVTDIWFNQELAFCFLRHSEVRNHMRQMSGDQAVKEAVGSVADAGTRNCDFEIPGFPKFHVTAAKRKVSSVPTYILDDDYCVLTTVVPGIPTDGDEIASTYTFRERKESGTGYNVREFEVPGRGADGGIFVVVSMSDVAEFTGNVCGGIISGCHS